MRLSSDTAQTIHQEAQRWFGEHSSIRLFGSRVDDTQRGGDIDLFLEPESYAQALENRFAFLASLQRMIGLQRIDLVIAHDSTRLIEQEARTKGIVL